MCHLQSQQLALQLGCNHRTQLQPITIASQHCDFLGVWVMMAHWIAASLCSADLFFFAALACLFTFAITANWSGKQREGKSIFPAWPHRSDMQIGVTVPCVTVTQSHTSHQPHHCQSHSTLRLPTCCERLLALSNPCWTLPVGCSLVHRG